MTVFYVAADGPVFVWKQQRPGFGTTASSGRFTSLSMAVDAAVIVARCYCGLFRCPACGTEYDPTYVWECPTCASVKRLTGDPLAARWQAEGGPSCDATWEDEPAPLCFECGEMIEGWAHQDDDGHYYCEGCCPVADCNDIDSSDLPF